MTDPEQERRCPMCGGKVRVVGHTTKHYEPVEQERVDRIADEAERRVKRAGSAEAFRTVTRESVRLAFADERGDLIAKAKRWRARGMLTDDEYGAICAVVLVSDEPPPPFVFERARELADQWGWK